MNILVGLSSLQRGTQREPRSLYLGDNSAHLVTALLEKEQRAGPHMMLQKVFIR